MIESIIILFARKHNLIQVINIALYLFIGSYNII